MAGENDTIALQIFEANQPFVWVMDRYQAKIDKDSGIVNDPNEWSEDPRHIVDLVTRMVRVSMETCGL